MNTEYITKIYSNYQTLKDSLKVARRSVVKEVSELHSRTLFKYESLTKVNPMLKSAEDELSDLSVWGLFAGFERQLRDELLDKGSKLLEIIPPELGERLTVLAQKEMERWRINEIIDLFDFTVDSEIRSKLKQILEYRNWIAHGRNPKKLPSVLSTDPKTTYDTIMEFVSQIELGTV